MGEAAGEDEESEFGMQGGPPTPTGGGEDHHWMPVIALAIQCLATSSEIWYRERFLES